MEYRWYIGKELDTTATLINLTQADWNELAGSGGGWVWAANQLRHVAGGISLNCDAVETKNDIFTVGETYQVSFVYTILTDYPAVKPYIGDFTLKKWECNKVSGTKVFDVYCRAGRKMRFSAANNCQLNGLAVYPYSWLPVLTGADCPIFDSQFSLNMQKSERILSLFINNIENAKFYGGSYQRLQALVNIGIQEIPVKIEARFNQFDSWFDVFEGVIYANEIKWDTKYGTAICDIEDSSEGTIILKNADKLTGLTFYDGRRWDAANPVFFEYIRDQVQFHNPSTGAYDIGTGTNDVYRVNEVLREMLYENTDLRVGLTSTTLATAEGYESGAPDTEYAGLTNMKRTEAHPFESGADDLYTIIETTLKELFNEYNKLFAVYGYVNTGTIKSLVVENLATLQVDSGLSFAGINDIIIEGYEVGAASIQVGFRERNYKGDSGLLRLNELSNVNEDVLDLSTVYFAGNDFYQRIAGALTDEYQNYHYRLQAGEDGTSGGRLAPIKNNDKTFLIEYNNVLRSVQGAVNLVFNPRFEPVNWITRHLRSILSLYNYSSKNDKTFEIYRDDNDINVSGLNNYIYKCEFTTLMDWSDYQTILSNPYAYITIQSDNLNPFTYAKINSQFIIESMEYNPETRLVNFKGYMT